MEGFGWSTPEFPVCAIVSNQATRGLRDHHGHGQSIEDGIQGGLARTHRFFRSHSLGNIHSRYYASDNLPAGVTHRCGGEFESCPASIVEPLDLHPFVCRSVAVEDSPAQCPFSRLDATAAIGPITNPLVIVSHFFRRGRVSAPDSFAGTIHAQEATFGVRDDNRDR